MDTYIAQLQPATLPEVDRLYVEPRIKLDTDDTVCGDEADTSDDEIDLDRYKMFRELFSKWIEKQEKRGFNINKVFFQDKKQFTRIYISGDAGHGKTALCKMLVLAWCQEHSGKKISEYIPDDFLAVMKKFDFLFYIPLRNIRKDWIISDIIKKQFFEDPNFLSLFIKNECDKNACLVILDGLDEWMTPVDYEAPMHTTHGLPDLSHFTKYTVLTTTRPWKLEVLRLGPIEMDRQVQLKGINRRASDRYIENMMDLLNKKKNVKKKSCDFKQHIKAKDLNHFLSIPILLKQLITLWHHDEEEITGRSQVHLYSAMLNHLLKDAWERNKKKPLSVQGMQDLELPLCLREKPYCKIHKSLLLSLAHLAFTAASNEQLIFDHVEAEYQNLTESDINSCLTAGLLCQEICTAPLDEEKKKLSFLHKTFQDFLAALYLVLKQESAKLPQTCSTGEKILDMRSLFYFVSGMDSEVMTSLIRQIQNILEDTEDHMKPVQDLLCECVASSEESGQPRPFCHLETVFIDTYHCGEISNACLDWKLQYLISSNKSCIKHVYITDPPKDLLTCLSLVSECQSVQHLNLTLKKSLSQDMEAQLDKAFNDKWSLKSLSLFGSICEPCYKYMYSDRLTSLVVLNIICVKISSPTECQRLMKGLERVTQLKMLDLYEVKYSEDGYRENCYTHLDLSHFLQLQRLSLLNCDISKVTINTTSLTDCRVCGTPVNFVPDNVTRIQTLTLGNVRDPNSLDEIISFLPHMIQLSHLSLTCLDFGDRDFCLPPDATHVKSVELHYVTMTDRAVIQFLSSVLSTNHMVNCKVTGQLSDAVDSYITTRFVVKQRSFDSLEFYSQQTSP